MTFTQPTKNIATFSQTNRGDYYSWDDIRVLWDDPIITWSEGFSSFTQPSKNITAFSQPTKN